MANVFAQCPETIMERQIRPKLIPGGFVWAVCFRLPQPAAEDGYIIQQITQQERGMQKKDGVLMTIPFRLVNYWEAWEVRKGEREPQQKQTINSFLADTLHVAPSLDPDYNIPMNDIFHRQYTVGAKGSYYISGLAGFYHGPLPSDFVVGNSATGAGALRSTTIKPPFWTHSGFQRSYNIDFTYETESEWRDDSKQRWNADRGKPLNMSFADNFMTNFYKSMEAGR